MPLAARGTEPERMDGDLLDDAGYARCLADLAAVNRLTLTHRPTLRWLRDATAAMPAEAEISILDVACGHGDLLRAIAGWAARAGRRVRLEGIDLNPRSAVAARAATAAAMAIRYRTGDVFDFIPDPSPDFIVTSQFTHHLGDAEIVALLGWLERHAARGWFIADLQRHAISYYGFPLLAFAAGWHPVVRTDGRISIARSFRRGEWRALLARAGIAATVTWHMPFRLCVGRLK